MSTGSTVKALWLASGWLRFAKALWKPCHATFLAAVAGLAFHLSPASAETAAPNPEFDQRVRNVLIRNPEVISNMLDLLKKRDEAANGRADQKLIASLANDLFAGLELKAPTLVEFLDYNCSQCRKAQSSVSVLKAQVPDLQHIIIIIPVLGPSSEFTAKAALALKSLKGTEAFYEFSSAMMKVEGRATAVTAIRVISGLGYDAEAVATAVREGIGADELQLAESLAAALNAADTPFFVGPRGIIRGLASANRLKAISKTANR